MPFVRCRFYTESGEPLRGGCRKLGAGTCAFVHPGNSDWTNAPPSSFKARDKNDESGGFKPWGKRGKSSADAGGGWDTGGSTSTPNQALAKHTRYKNTSTLSSGWSPIPTASENTIGGESGWGGGADKASGSAWGSDGNDTWGASSWGANKDTGEATGSGWGSAQTGGWGAGGGGNMDTGEATGSGWGSAQTGGWGAGWGENTDKDAGSTWGSARNDESGAGWGDKDTANSWGVSDPMVVDNHAEKETKQSKGKGKAVPRPPRIRVPNSENKKPKISGTNNEPLGLSRWGESRSSSHVTASTPVTTSTPTVTPSTLPDSSRIKRKRDTVFDDKSDGFKEYVKTWERGVRARFLLAEAEAKRDRWFRTQKSGCYTRIGEAGRKRLDGQRAECDKEVSSQREKLSGAITSLVELHDTMSSNFDLGQRYNIGKEAEKFIVESKAFVDEVRALLVTHVLRDKNEVQSGDTQKHPSGADATSIDSLRSQVQDLEERFDQAQTELTLRHQRDIRSEIDELLTVKVADLRVARQREIDRVASQPRPEIVIPPSTLESIEGTAQQVRELDAKIPHTVEEIRVLLLRVDATSKRVSELEEEVSVNKETQRKMQEMAAEKEEIDWRADGQLQKIREQFEQLAASRLSNPAAQSAVSPTTYDSRDELMERLWPAFEAMLDKFYEREVRPTLASLQQVAIEASDRHQEEAIKVLWGKIQPAMNMVAGVSRWLDSQELGLTAPVEDM